MQTKNAVGRATRSRAPAQQVERIRTEPISDDELQEAQALSHRQLPLRLDSNAKIADFIAQAWFYEPRCGLRRTYIERVNAVTIADVQRVAQAYLHPERFIEVVVTNARATATHRRGAPRRARALRSTMAARRAHARPRAQRLPSCAASRRRASRATSAPAVAPARRSRRAARLRQQPGQRFRLGRSDHSDAPAGRVPQPRRRARRRRATSRSSARTTTGRSPSRRICSIAPSAASAPFPSIFGRPRPRARPRRCSCARPAAARRRPRAPRDAGARRRAAVRAASGPHRIGRLGRRPLRRARHRLPAGSAGPARRSRRGRWAARRSPVCAPPPRSAPRRAAVALYPLMLLRDVLLLAAAVSRDSAARMPAPLPPAPSTLLLRRNVSWVRSSARRPIALVHAGSARAIVGAAIGTYIGKLLWPVAATTPTSINLGRAR